MVLHDTLIHINELIDIAKNKDKRMGQFSISENSLIDIVERPEQIKNYANY